MMDMKIMELLNEIEDIVEGASGVPLTSKVLVSKEEVLEILGEIRIQLPDEIKQAEWIKNERDNILREAETEAETIVAKANEQAEVIVSQDNIFVMANQKANEMMTNATEEARNLRLGTMKYADELLLKTQKDLANMIEVLNDNRKQLKENAVEIEK